SERALTITAKGTQRNWNGWQARRSSPSHDLHGQTLKPRPVFVKVAGGAANGSGSMSWPDPAVAVAAAASGSASITATCCVASAYDSPLWVVVASRTPLGAFRRSPAARQRVSQSARPVRLRASQPQPDRALPLAA